jgi:hypothetical protein
MNTKRLIVRMPHVVKNMADCVRLWDISTDLLGMDLPI